MSPGDAYGFTDDLVLERVDLTGDGGVRKLVITRGEPGAPPAAGDTVHAHYDGRLAADGSQFDSSYNRGAPFSFKLGAGQVIKAWDVAFAKMALGEKAVIEVAPGYGYGARGAGSVIPPNAKLYFLVELMAYGDRKKGAASTAHEL